mgnify:CR=1 FL=1
MQRRFRFKITSEVVVNERPVNKPNHRGYRAEKMIQKGVTDIGPRFRFCYYVHTPNNRRVFGQFASEYREGDLIKLLEGAVRKGMFQNNSLIRLNKVIKEFLLKQ